jgi:hypothetical protein
MCEVDGRIIGKLPPVEKRTSLWHCLISIN